jgi:hypothetical protein
MVYWKEMLKNKQGDAPMRAFDTTIEAKAYIDGCADIITTYSSDKLSAVELKREFKIEGINNDTKNKSKKSI